MQVGQYLPLYLKTLLACVQQSKEELAQCASKEEVQTVEDAITHYREWFQIEEAYNNFRRTHGYWKNHPGGQW